MIRCEGDEARGLVHIWKPSWTQPRIIDFAAEIPGGKILGRSICRWLNVNAPNPAIFFSDSQDCLLTYIPQSDDEEVPWCEAESQGSSGLHGSPEESPLHLLTSESKRGLVTIDDPFEDEGDTEMSGGSDEVEDTFRFRKFVEPG